MIGLSHRTAPVRLLEQTALTEELVVKLLGDTVGSEYVSEAVAVATCNRLEVYAEVSKFHGALAEVSELLAQYTGVPRDVLTRHFYVHYDDRAAWHMFTVACGLDSMVVGEPQILGQLRTALARRPAGRHGRAASSTSWCSRRCASASARTARRRWTRPGSRWSPPRWTSLCARAARPPRRTVVVGAGSMSALAATTILRRYPEAALTVVNRTPERAERLAAAVNGTAAPLSELPTASPTPT